METRRLFTAFLAAMAVYLAYQMIRAQFRDPPPANPTTQQLPPESEGAGTETDDGALTGAAPIDDILGAPSDASDAPVGTDGVTDIEPTPEQRPSGAAMAPTRQIGLRGGTTPSTIQLGAPNGPLRVTLSAVGATVEQILISEHIDGDPEKPLRYAARPDAPGEPYALLQAVDTLDDSAQPVTLRSFETASIIVHGDRDQRLRLDDLVWKLVAEESDASRATFEVRYGPVPDEAITAVPGSDPVDDPASADPRADRNGDASGEAGEDRFIIRKQYTLDADLPLVRLAVSVRNLTDLPLSFTLEQDGAIGIARERVQYDMRRVVAGFVDAETVSLSSKTRDALAQQRGKALRPFLGQQTLSRTEQRQIDDASWQRLASGEAPVRWVALGNRFFGVFMRPIAADEASTSDFLSHASAASRTARPLQSFDLTDMTTRLVSRPQTAPPGATKALAFEIYAGPKEAETLARINPAFADSTQLGYYLTLAEDRACLCTFEPLPTFMVWLLHSIYNFVGNYGIAIIILVIIVRTILHPLTVFQQKSMYRMQEDMSRVQPKMQEIREKYANDKKRQNEEMIKLWSEEGINPAGQLVGILPMLLQMPILVALWVSLSADVQLRHAPFVGWINDLSTPDALITFTEPIDIPMLGYWFAAFRDIPAFNLLPLLMGVSMYLQQKYMPKPNQQARREAAEKRHSDNPTAFEQQMRQQQTIAIMMSVMFPLLFYYMPSGLNLYWMATNVFGICETLLVRRQIEREKAERAERGDVDPPKKQGFISRWLKDLASQAEELQKKADKVSERPPAKRISKRRKSTR